MLALWSLKKRACNGEVSLVAKPFHKRISPLILGLVIPVSAVCLEATSFGRNGIEKLHRGGRPRYPGGSIRGERLEPRSHSVSEVGRGRLHDQRMNPIGRFVALQSVEYLQQTPVMAGLVLLDCLPSGFVERPNLLSLPQASDAVCLCLFHFVVDRIQSSFGHDDFLVGLKKWISRRRRQRGELNVFAGRNFKARG